MAEDGTITTIAFGDEIVPAAAQPATVTSLSFLPDTPTSDIVLLEDGTERLLEDGTKLLLG